MSFKERYEIVRCLGAGSIGVVYLCQHRELAGHLVAIKILSKDTAKDEAEAARFSREIIAAYGVCHPNVVRAYEYFCDRDLIGFTMEYVDGGNLGQEFDNGLPLDTNRVIDLLRGIILGLQAIHDAGMIHGNLKPANILLTKDGIPKICDFGIAQTEMGLKLMEHGGIEGTIDYVAPEFLERDQMDVRSDLYAVGVLAYQMITGRLPFEGSAVIETMTQRLRQDPNPPDKLVHACPSLLSDFVMKTLSRNPDTRFQSAREMAEELDRVAQCTVIH
jgi:eukaryotic-like serine/threonine-protein kinase